MPFRIRDDRQRELLLARTPQRIVSLVPSDTDTLFALGAGARVVGRTRFCVEPAGAAEIPVCGGTKDVDVDTVAALAPDLILCNQEENARPALEKLAQAGFAVFVSFPRRLADGVAHVARLARMLDIAGEPGVRDLVRRGLEVVRQAEAARASRTNRAPLRVFVPIWMDPLMTLSGDTYGSDMLALAGGENAFADRQRRYPLAADLGNARPLDQAAVGERDTRYPRVTLDEVRGRAPAALLLPDEPYAFDPAEAARLGQELGLPPAAVRAACGKDLFWYGARGIDALPRLTAAIASLREALEATIDAAPG
ncbi:MAG TPA: helical backbone metal receptor [Haliangium sp.]|nr:helical backbone metal receptor [Haliangium sp.]